MNRFFFLFFLISVLCQVNPLFGQLKHGSEIISSEGKYYQYHTVEKGETFFSVIKKYQWEKSELLRLNPSSTEGLKTGMKLLVPVEIKIDKNHESFQVPEKEMMVFLIHVVGKGETSFSVARQYSINSEELVRYNPQAEKGIRTNERLKIPKALSSASTKPASKETIQLFDYKVKTGETYYSLSKRYGLTVEELRQMNPEAPDPLPVDWLLKIKSKPEQDSKPGTSLPTYMGYTIEKGDTFSKLKRKFGLSKEELILLNPELAGGLKRGMEIRLPGSIDQVDRQKTPVVGQKEYHLVQKGETLFGIANSKGVSPNEILAVNPGLEGRSLITGEKLLIPEKKILPSLSLRKEEPEIESKEKSIASVPENLPFPKEKNKIRESDTLAIALMMPFYLDKNSNLNEESERLTDAGKNSSQIELNKMDTVHIKQNKDSEIFDQSKSALNFYEGFLLALDTLQKDGVNIKVKVYDTEQKVSKILSDHWLLEAGLIVGPRDVKMQPAVSAFSAKNRIPMVAPFLANDSLVHHCPYFFQLTPSKNYILERTADFVAERFVGQNIIVLTTGDFKKTNEWNMIERLKDQLGTHSHLKKGGHIVEVPFTGGGDQGHIQTRGSMKKDLENVVLVPLTENRKAREATLARVVNALQVLSKNFNITLVGLSDYPRFESINTEYYHRLKLHYLTPSFIDYEDTEVKNFVKKYRENFKGEPDPYSFRGYDIALFFGESYRIHGDKFLKQIATVRAKSLQDHFYFKKYGQFEGFISQSLFVVNFDTDWEIRKAGLLIGDKITLFQSKVENEKTIEP